MMPSSWKGNPRYPLLLERIITQSEGRLVILVGEPGVGKTTLALLTLANLYGENFLFSPSFQFFRLDDYSMKLSYFIENPSSLRNLHLHMWGIQFLLQLSQLINLKEIKSSHVSYKKQSQSIDEFRNYCNQLLLQQTFAKTVFEDKEFQKIVLHLAEEVSKKKSIPIAFIQEVIYFHRYKSETPRCTFIGGWENATLEAQNASLKLFEEMPINSRIILHTNSLENILPTILSRSLVVSLPPLSPSLVEEILGMPSHFSSCFFHMREVLFKEKSKASDMARYFCEDLGFRIQYGDEIFDFVQKVSINPIMVQFFLEEIINYMRKPWILHQTNIRTTEKNPLPSRFMTYTSEITEWKKEINRIQTLLKKNTIQPLYPLTDLLIKLARWMQKRKID